MMPIDAKRRLVAENIVWDMDGADLVQYAIDDLVERMASLEVTALDQILADQLAASNDDVTGGGGS